MQEGVYLGQPPVRIGTSRAAAVLESMLRGSASYSMAAGGFGQVPALPQLQGGLKPMPASPAYQVGDVAFYSLTPANFKRDLRRRFGG